MTEPSPGQLRQTLLGVPDAAVARTATIERAIDDSVRYLDSEAALRSLAADSYWPKWDSPWWHMLHLFELGEARRIPGRVVRTMIERVDATVLKIFPLTKEELGGADPHRGITCHCALGSLAQVLAACGVEVARELPWVEPWFVRYQMADGGLNCDETAYLVTDECPSSMVATIAPLEAMLFGDPAAWSPEHAAFVDRGARFLIDRRLMLGSPTRHNADERDAAPGWLQPCTPRFYFYDVLRGLTALVRWAEHTGGSIPVATVAPVIDHLATTFPDGIVRVGRDAVAGRATRRLAADGSWERGPASRSALLDATSVVGAPRASATAEWAATRAGLVRLIEAGRLTVIASPPC